MVSRLAVLTAFVSALSIGVAAAPLSGNETEVLVARQLGNTANDVTNRVCRSTTLLFARGTTESGNIGGTVGPALGDALKSALGASNVAVQGIDYPADLGGLTIGQTNPASAQGSIDCSNKVAALLSYCPSTRIVITGYSQGAQQVHGCLLRLSQTQANSVKAAVTFGDPLRTTSFDKISSSRAKVFCNSGDAVCNGQFVILLPHLTYTSTAITPAVQFIRGQS